MEESMLTWKEVFKEESKSRLNLDVNKLCKYGIRPLDDALKCIMPNELVVIGADSGAGKSELGLHIALTNAKQNKTVALYFLEGGHIEAMARMKWRDVAKKYYDKYSSSGIEMDYSLWRTNQMKDLVIQGIESEVYEEYQNELKNNLFIYPISEGFTLADLTSSLWSFHSLETAFAGIDPSGFNLDLIVIDHLQYFSLAEKETEIEAITNILKAVNHITSDYKIPVVLISHLVKKKMDRGLPDQEDFYGTSNIPKISSTAIVISPDSKNENFSTNIYHSFFRIVKSRVGVRSSLAMRVEFDLKTRSYCDEYELYRVGKKGLIAKNPLSDDEKPNWAT